MANKQLVKTLLIIIPFILISCNSVKIKNRKLNNNIEFQYEKNGALKEGYNYLHKGNENFELVFLYQFNDSVYVSKDTIELFAEKIMTEERTDNPNVVFLLNVEKYKNRLINIKIPAKELKAGFYLSDKYRYMYMFYYEEKLIIRYSNKIYNIY